MLEPKVWVIDDDAAVLESLRWLIESVGYEVETYSNARDFLRNYDPEKSGCLVLDMRMPDMSGLELQETLQQRNVDVPIVFITGHGDVTMAVRAMKAGAIEFLIKPVNNQLLLEAINKAIKHDVKRRATMKKSAEIISRAERLTPRERQVMELMVLGKLTKTIAHELGISISTAELHRAKVMKKMRVRSLAELVRLVLVNDLVPVPEEA